ncbi:3-hydroxyacyl-thioester dehydratase [Amycolatopsis sp. K13G38]|uniref:3-hydroxyacyl-thioester dehydratase n=1 Tax=Amycolatopsis acididurans TaxID=2724524 RepID=A0ABX1J238_9PSEU|nr:MaoC/PaaZ C-terminal domain-containing protein [Amycolatopsis acididurans]NKQ52420.1 3-hydroxyacyl-thioester dehydratase [Amycolatopsis acididurans]
MPLDLGSVGAVSAPWTREWSSDDTLLYALALGAGPDSPELTTENSVGLTQRAFPTYAALIAGGSHAVRDRLGSWERTALVHAGQEITWFRELPAAGSATLTSTVAGITDKGTGALVEIRTTAAEPATGEPLFESTTRLFIRGAGGFGRTSAAAARPGPEGPPDDVLTFRLSDSQALLYRLCGDRNPLHSDPVFARRAGFERPILHGLCTFGITARLLMNHVLGGDPARMISFAGRFRAPVLPGDELAVRLWHTAAGRVEFTTATSTVDTVAVDEGVLTYTEEAAA